MICPCILIDYYYAMRSVVRRSSNNHMRTLVDTSRQFCSASPVKSIDIQLTLPWTLGGQQSLRLDHSQSLTSTLVNFKYTPMAKHGDGQKENDMSWVLWIFPVAVIHRKCPVSCKSPAAPTPVSSSLCRVFSSFLWSSSNRSWSATTRALPISADPPGTPRLRRLARTGGFQGFSSFRLPVVGSTCRSWSWVWLVFDCPTFPRILRIFEMCHGQNIAYSCIFMYIHVYSCIFMYIHVYSCIFMYIHNVYWVWSSIAVPGICPSLTMAQRVFGSWGFSELLGHKLLLHAFFQTSGWALNPSIQSHRVHQIVTETTEFPYPLPRHTY